jgi:NTE family protein
MKKHNLGIALSGGGARGFAHIGVLHALNERGIFPDVIAGTSSGSIAGALYASGMKPYDIYETMKNTKFTEYTKMHIPKDGFFTLNNLRVRLEKLIPQTTFEELDIPLFVCLSNFNNGKAEYFNSGPLHKVIQASCSIPVLIAPVKINDTLYVDGGLVDNLPVKPLVRRCEKIIGLNVLPHDDITKIDSLFHAAVRVFQISLNNNIRYYKKKCDIYIEPKNLNKYNILETRHSDQMFEIGYKHAKKINLKALKM